MARESRETTEYLQRKIGTLLDVLYSADSPVRYALTHSTSMATRVFLPLRSRLHILRDGVVVSKTDEFTHNTYTLKLFAQQLLRVFNTNNTLAAWDMLVRDARYSVMLYHDYAAPHGRKVPKVVLRVMGSKLLGVDFDDLRPQATTLSDRGLLTVLLWNIMCAPTNAHAAAALDTTIHKRWIPIVENQGRMTVGIPDCHLCAFQAYVSQWHHFVGTLGAEANCPGCPLSEYKAKQNCLSSMDSAFDRWAKLPEKGNWDTQGTQAKADAAQHMLDVLYDVRQHFWDIPPPSDNLNPTETPTEKGTA